MIPKETLQNEERITLDDSICSYSLFLEKYASVNKFDRQEGFYRTLYAKAFKFVNRIVHQESRGEMKMAAESVLERALKSEAINSEELIKLYEDKIPDSFYPSKVGGGMLTKEGLKRMLVFYADKEAKLFNEMIALNYMLD